jgi:hypothetical protein
MIDMPRIPQASGEFWRIAGYTPVLTGDAVADLDIEPVDVDRLGPGTYRDAMWVSMDDTYAELALSLTISGRRPSAADPAEPDPFELPATTRVARPAVTARRWRWFVVLLTLVVGGAWIFLAPLPPTTTPPGTPYLYTEPPLRLTPPPAPGTRIVTGQGYTLTYPETWSSSVSFARGAHLVRRDYARTEPLLLDLSPKPRRSRRPSAPTVNVTSRWNPSFELESQRIYRRGARRRGAHDLSTTRRTYPGYEEALSFRYRMTSSRGVHMRAREVVAVHGGSVYTVTLRATRSTYHRASKDFNAMLDSWTWTL